MSTQSPEYTNTAHQVPVIEQVQKLRHQENLLKNTSGAVALSKTTLDISSGEAAMKYVGYSEVDISKSDYQRDYEQLVEAGVAIKIAERGNGRVVSIKGNPSLSKFDREEKAEEIFANSVVHIKLGEVGREVEDKVPLVAEGKEPYLGIAFDKNDPTDQVVMDTLDSIRVGLVGYEEDRDNPDILHAKINQIDRFGEGDMYIDTDSGRQFVDAIEKAGLVLKPGVIKELAFENEHRYGNGYAWLTRELAKSINAPDRGIPIFESSEGVEDLERTGDRAADVAIDVIQQLATRDSNVSDIPVTRYNVAMKMGSCKDAEEYYSQSLFIKSMQRTIDVSGRKFWHKGHGVGTYINLEPVMFNGIELPPGFLFNKSPDDDKFYVQRATGFCFEEAEAKEVFGPHMYNQSDDSLRKVFDAFERDIFAVERSRRTNEK